MKKTLFLFLAISTIYLAHSQKVTFGVKGGVNYSGFNGKGRITEILNYKYKFGYHLYGFTKLKISDKLYLKSELGLSLQGAKLKDNFFFQDFNGAGFGPTEIRIVNNLYYLNLPILGKYYVTEKLSIEAGPQLGYFLSGKIKQKILDSGGLSQDEIDNLNNSQNIDSASSFDFGANLGIGYDLSNNISLNTRYHYGVTKIFKKDSPFKNSLAQLSLEYTFK